MSLNELTPTELLTIYLMNKNKLDKYNNILETGQLVEELVISEMSVMSSRILLAEESLDKLRESVHYQFIVELDKKLSPAADLIMDVDPDLHDKIIDSFKETI